MIAKKIIFSGRVQGVGFRYTTKEVATGYDVVGSVKNLSDGSVELLIMGESDETDAYLSELTEESAVSHFIREMQTEEVPLLENAKGFVISR
ncbi:MAG TPA: acylphosphatase [Verrucomicrobiales bacterium]|nr:acylphosphatase [Verrucomicrobiales bacterium]|tara:strand:+ start:1009 stop:1284 length:276 start_codon:yes stop_codon:yes gene_type:complete